jgi:hypothetical protein
MTFPETGGPKLGLHPAHAMWTASKGFPVEIPYLGGLTRKWPILRLFHPDFIQISRNCLLKIKD